MTRKLAGWSVLAVLWLVAGAAGQASAGLVYTYDFKFDALTFSFNGATYTYAPAEFVARSPTLLTNPGDTTSVVPPGDLNGFSVASVEIDPTYASDTFMLFVAGAGSGGPQGDGDVQGFGFYVTKSAVAPGVYTTDSAGRLFTFNNGVFAEYANGSLTIATETAAVPEPATLVPALSSVALVGLGYVWRKRRRAIA
jgi:hypothetical protein